MGIGHNIKTTLFQRLKYIGSKYSTICGTIIISRMRKLINFGNMSLPKK